MVLGRRIVAVASLVLILGVLLAEASAPATAATTDVQLREKTCSTRGSFCHADTEFLESRMGGEFTFNLKLLSRSDGSTVGREHGQCVTLNRAARGFFCDFVVNLADGSVAVQGTFSFTADTNVVPIVGGTGAYESAGGYWSQTNARVDLHIVTP